MNDIQYMLIGYVFNFRAVKGCNVLQYRADCGYRMHDNVFTSKTYAQIKATSASGATITLYWDHALNADENHMAAANAPKNKMGWKGNLIQGCLKDSYVHVFEVKS